MHSIHRRRVALTPAVLQRLSLRPDIADLRVVGFVAVDDEL